jgi:hypothetical protein
MSSAKQTLAPDRWLRHPPVKRKGVWGHDERVGRSLQGRGTAYSHGVLVRPSRG